MKCSPLSCICWAWIFLLSCILSKNINTSVISGMCPVTTETWWMISSTAGGYRHVLERISGDKRFQKSVIDTGTTIWPIFSTEALMNMNEHMLYNLSCREGTVRVKTWYRFFSASLNLNTPKGIENLSCICACKAHQKSQSLRIKSKGYFFTVQWRCTCWENESSSLEDLHHHIKCMCVSVRCGCQLCVSFSPDGCSLLCAGREGGERDGRAGRRHHTRYREHEQCPLFYLHLNRSWVTKIRSYLTRPQVDDENAQRKSLFNF